MNGDFTCENKKHIFCKTILMPGKISKWPFHAIFQNTFQAILVTDETYSYVVFIYKCGLMEWDNGAIIGYTSNGDPFDNHNPSSREVACVNIVHIQTGAMSSISYLKHHHQVMIIIAVSRETNA